MAFKIGDRVIYEEKDDNGECIQGEIVDIWRNTGKSRPLFTNLSISCKKI